MSEKSRSRSRLGRSKLAAQGVAVALALSGCSTDAEPPFKPVTPDSIIKQFEDMAGRTASALTCLLTSPQTTTRQYNTELGETLASAQEEKSDPPFVGLQSTRELSPDNDVSWIGQLYDHDEPVPELFVELQGIMPSDDTFTQGPLTKEDVRRNSQNVIGRMVIISDIRQGQDGSTKDGTMYALEEPDGRISVEYISSRGYMPHVTEQDIHRFSRGVDEVLRVIAARFGIPECALAG